MSLEYFIGQLRCDVTDAADDRIACESEGPLGLPTILSVTDEFGGRIDRLVEVSEEVVKPPRSH